MALHLKTGLSLQPWNKRNVLLIIWTSTLYWQSLKTRLNSNCSMWSKLDLEIVYLFWVREVIFWEFGHRNRWLMAILGALFYKWFTNITSHDKRMTKVKRIRDRTKKATHPINWGRFANRLPDRNIGNQMSSSGGITMKFTGEELWKLI